MRSGRRYRRFKRRLEVEFSSGDIHYRGISSNFSLGGLFVRTNHAFAPGTLVNLTVHLPEGGISFLKGNVKMAFKTPGISLKNGMGIEIFERDAVFVDFVKSLSTVEEPLTEGESAADRPERSGPAVGVSRNAEDFIIIKCSGCGVKNRVRKSRISEAAVCGKCGASLRLQT